MLRPTLTLFAVFVLGLLPVRAGQFAFGVEELVESSEAGKGTILLAAPATTSPWSANSDASWLTVETVAGTGDALLQYSFAANPDRKPRTARLTAGDTTVAITQAGATYAHTQSPIVLAKEGLVSPSPYGLAVDGEGNLYISDAGDKTIKKWTAMTGVLSTLIASGIGLPTGLAVGPRGEIAFADMDGNKIGLWDPRTGAIRTLLAGEDLWPTDVAYARDGQVLLTDLGDHHEIRCVNPENGAVTVLYDGVAWPQGVAVDVCGDLYLADSNGNDWGVIRYSPSTDTARPLVYSGDSGFIYGVGVDAAGNVYFTEGKRPGGGSVGKWDANSREIEFLHGWGDGNGAMAVDARGNVFITDGAQKQLQAIPNSWVDPTAQEVGVGAGTATLPPVLPAATNLSGPYAPTSDQPWLTVTSVADGVIRYAFSANTTGTDRVAQLSVLGQSIQVRQSAGVVTLGARKTLAGAEAVVGSVLVDAATDSTRWTAEKRVGWIHLAQTSGIGDAVLSFSCDANPHHTPREGVIAIGGTEFVVTQAGIGYVPVSQAIKLPIEGLGIPSGLAADADGNLVIADSQNNRILKWWARTRTVTQLVEAGIDGPAGVAIDAAGNVVFADSRNNAVKRWNADTGTVETLVGSGLSRPDGIAITPEGDVLFADVGNNAIKRWSAADGTVSTLVGSGLNGPGGVTVDLLGNVSFGDRLNYATKRRLKADGSVQVLDEGGGFGVAADGCGNVLLGHGGTLRRWSPASGSSVPLTTLAQEMLGHVAVDGRGNVYFAAMTEKAIYTLRRAYVDVTPRMEGPGGLLKPYSPVLAEVVDLAGVYAPKSDQTWLVFERVDGGRMYYYTLYNRTGVARTAHFTVLGQQISVTQQASATWNYAAFKAWRFTPEECANPAISGPEADPSGTGVTNLQAYAFGLNPKDPDLLALPQVQLDDERFAAVDDGQGGYQLQPLDPVLQLSVRKSLCSTDLVYVVEASSDLVNWEPVAPDWDDFGSGELYTSFPYHDFAGAGAAHRFMRVRVSLR